MKRNVYLERKMARKLPIEVQKEVMFAAREHAKKVTNKSWTIPTSNSLLIKKGKLEMLAMNRIWYDVVVLGSQQGRI